MKKFLSFCVVLFLMITPSAFSNFTFVKEDPQVLLNSNASKNKIPSVDVQIEELTMESFVISYRINEFKIVNGMTIDIYKNENQWATRFEFFDLQTLKPSGEIVVDNNNLGDVQMEGFQIEPSVEYKVITTIYLPKNASIFDVQKFSIDPFLVSMNTFEIEQYTKDGFIFSLDIDNPDSLNGDLFLYDSTEFFSTSSLEITKKEIQKDTFDSNVFQVYGMDSGKSYTNLTLMIDNYNYGKIDQTISIPKTNYTNSNLLLFLVSFALIFLLMFLLSIVAILTRRNYKYNQNAVNNFDDN